MPTMAPRISGGAHSALYIGTIMDSEPTPIPATVSFPIGCRQKTRGLTRDETTCENGVVTRPSDRRRLDHNTDDEDGSVDQDGVLAREDLGKET
jgi:hypothetical protein